MRLHRRKFLKRLVAAAGTIGISLGLWKPRLSQAAEWPRDAYGAATVADALRNLYGTSGYTASSAVKVRAPSRVQGGGIVPISVSADLSDVRAISILIEKNLPPLAAHINFSGAAAFFAINVRMPSTSAVRVVVNAGGRLYTSARNIEVVVGT